MLRLSGAPSDFGRQIWNQCLLLNEAAFAGSPGEHTGIPRGAYQASKRRAGGGRAGGQWADGGQASVDALMDRTRIHHLGPPGHRWDSVSGGGGSIMVPAAIPRAPRGLEPWRTFKCRLDI